MEQTEIFKKYINDLQSKKKLDKKTNTLVFANPWASQKTKDWYDDCWNKIVASGLVFDGKHITLTERGVSYDYVAYKNKMLLAYPESQIDVELVYKGDTFAFEKTNGIVDYKHIFANPFTHKDDDIIGGYCVIKNKRGDFLTTLSLEEIQKAKSVALTQAIWVQWFAEMAKKTVIKKAIKFHFDDIYCQIEEEDNKNYDLDKAPENKPELPEALKNAIAEAPDLSALRSIYAREYNGLANAALKAEFASLCTLRKKEISK